MAHVWITAFAALFISSSYVAVLHLPQNRTSLARPRDHPKLITNRMTSIMLVSVFWVCACPFLMRMVLRTTSSVIQGVAVLGVVPGLRYKHEGYQFALSNALQYLIDISHAALLIALLFVGPLVELVFFRKNFRGQRVDVVQDVLEQFQTVYGIRDIVIGPISEELVYRSALVGLFIAARAPVDVVILCTPLYFGVAHLNHAVEFWREGVPPLQILTVCGFQLAYTTVFGVLEAYIFARTGNAAAVILVHSFCNYMGFPRLSVEGPTWQRLSYWALLVVGLQGFWVCVGVLTESKNGGIVWH